MGIFWNADGSTEKGEEMKVLVLLSGGVDSATALGLAVDRYGKDNVTALSVFYGQRHDKEVQASAAVADYYGVEWVSVDLQRIFSYSDSSLLKHSEKELPEKSYIDQILESGDSQLVSTYVPFRNGMFLSCAASIAMSKGCDVIYYGIHADDTVGSAVYPDCSPVFNEAMGTAVWEGSGHQLKIEAPFVNMKKAEIIRTGLSLKVPYERTWSCYEGGEKPCGKCATCIDRAAAFAANGAKDPALGGNV